MERVVAKSETIPHDVRDLRAFCLVVELGSVTQAARRLGETKGSVSRRLSRLEAALAVPLLRRSPRLVQPTEEGAAYHERVVAVLDRLDAADAELRGLHVVPSGLLRVTAPHDLAQTTLAAPLAAFARRHPRVALEVVLSEAVLDVDRERIDVALRVSAQLPDSSWVARRLCTLSGGLYAAPSVLAGRPAPRHVADLRDLPLVLHRAGVGRATIPLVGPGGARCELVGEPAVIASDFAFLRGVVVEGFGCAVLPDHAVQADVAAGRLVRVLPEWGFEGVPLYLMYAGARLLSAKVAAFRDHMLEAFGQPQATRGAGRARTGG